MHASRAHDWNIQGCHGVAKAVRKEITAIVSPGVEHLGHTRKSDPGLDHRGKQGPGIDHHG